jgi:hypothetical protein
VIWLDPSFWFWVPLGLAVICVLPVWAVRDRTVVTWLGATSVGFVVLSLLATAFWSWFFKDGLGPGFVPTSGLKAWLRFWDLVAVPLAIAATETLLIVMICRRRLSRLRSSVAVALE